ncbi:MAG: hypothetical protein M1496_07835 [Candidatus Thermoplasmatota archaeon]|jgi:hypothetical protein|nr:hypothetical protein [Candidatus Thermoplasmatota archaeon]
MSKTIIAIIAVTVLLMSGSAFAFSNAGTSASSSLSVKTVDGFTLSYSSTSGFVNNVSYATGSGNVTVSNSIYVNGTASLSSMMKGYQFSFDNGNVFVYGNEMPRAVSIVTSGSASSPANMKVNLNEKATKVSAGFQVKASSDSNLGGLSFSTFVGVHMNEYVIENANFSGFFMTDGIVTISNSGQTLSIEQNTSTQMMSYMPLVSIFVTSGNLKNLINEYEKNRVSEKFTYSASTGNVTGRNVAFNFNTTTGTLTNLKIMRSGTMNELISSMNVSGNGKIGQGTNIPNFQLGAVQTFGSLFLYANSSFILNVHDNPVAQGTLVIDNATATIVAPSGSNLTYFATGNVNLKVNASMVSSNTDIQEKAVFGFDHSFSTGTAAVRIVTPSNQTEFLMIDGGTLKVTGNTIKVNSTGAAMIHFVSPPGLSNLGKYRASIEDAISHGKIAAQMIINGSTEFGNFTVGFNSSVHSNVSQISHGKVTLTFSATAGHHTGTDVAIFLSKQFLNGSTQVYLKFDGSIVTVTSMSDILNVTSTTNASFAVYTENSGDLLILHIPHFSNHTVEISTTPFTSSPVTGNLNEYVTIGALIVAVVVIVGVAYFIRKK